MRLTRPNALQRLLNLARRVLDYGRVDVLTIRQQLRFAAIAAALGAVVAVLAEREIRGREPAPAVVIGEPFIERAATDYSVVRIPFAYFDVEAACHVVTYHRDGKFTVRC